LIKENYYAILEVEKTATKDQIKSSYRKLSKKFHPDKNPKGEEQFKKIAEAYSILGDPEKRKAYDNPVHTNVNDAYSRHKAQGFDTMDLSYLNIQMDRHYKLSELMEGIELTVDYQISKSSLSDSKFENRQVKVNVNLSTAPYPLIMVDGKMGVMVRVRHAGSSQEIDGVDFFNRRQHGIATGDLFIRVIIDMQGLEFTDTSDIVQRIDISLYEVLFAEEIILQSPLGKKYKIKAFNTQSLSDLQVRIPEQGLVGAFGRRGSYIFRLIVIKPDFSKISSGKLATLKESLRDLDK